MPQAFTASPSVFSIERPNCPKCGTRMSVAHISVEASRSQHTFECSKCDNSLSETVAVKPRLTK
jgi:transcription elongation factor Elf1